MAEQHRTVRKQRRRPDGTIEYVDVPAKQVVRPAATPSVSTAKPLPGNPVNVHQGHIDRILQDPKIIAAIPGLADAKAALSNLRGCGGCSSEVAKKRAKVYNRVRKLLAQAPDSALGAVKERLGTQKLIVQYVDDTGSVQKQVR